MNNPYAIQPGYSFVLSGPGWKGSDSEDWELEILTTAETENAVYVETRTIDDHLHRIWQLQSGRFAAQLVVAVGVKL